MTTLKRNAKCIVHSADEIGLLSESINGLYSKLLQTIGNLEHEKEQVAEVERQKIDFLRMASHELKTPVTALNAILDNMVMGIGKYKDYNAYLPLCKERSEQIAKMITEILDTSNLGTSIDTEPSTTFDVTALLLPLCEQYQLIAQAKGMIFRMALLNQFPVCLPPKMISKAVSNSLRLMAGVFLHSAEPGAMTLTGAFWSRRILTFRSRRKNWIRESFPIVLIM